MDSEEVNDMSERLLLDAEPTYSWAQNTLVAHQEDGNPPPFTLMRLQEVADGFEAVVELPNGGGEPYRRLGRVRNDMYETEEKGKLLALKAALENDYPQVQQIRSAEDSGLYNHGSIELLLDTGETNVFNSYATGENAAVTALVEGVAAVLVTK